MLIVRVVSAFSPLATRCSLRVTEQFKAMLEYETNPIQYRDRFQRWNTRYTNFRFEYDFATESNVTVHQNLAKCHSVLRFLLSYQLKIDSSKGAVGVPDDHSNVPFHFQPS